MSNEPRRAAIYLRLSLDRYGDELGIDRQREATTALVKARGWTLVREFADNSISASKTRGPETAWGQMLIAAENGDFDTVVSVDLDRLLRSTSDLLRLIDAGVKVATTDGELDLTTADGELRATMLAAFARFEVRRKAERQVRANAQRRKMGFPVGKKRIFGFADDGITPIPEEADAVRATFSGYLNGVPMRRLALDLNDEHVQPVGTPFAVHSVVRMLQNARYAGLIEYQGNVQPGNFEAIVSEDVWRAAVARMRDPARKSASGSQPRYLLPGIAVCGRCGGPMRTSGDPSRGRLYRCRRTPHLSRRADPIDEFVEAVIVGRLQRPDAASLFADVPDVDVDALREERTVIQSRIDGLAGLFAEGVLDTESVRSSSAELRQRINQIDAELSGSGGDSVLHGVVDAEDVQAAWDGLDIERRRLVVRALADITILPVGRGRRPFMPESVGIEWKE